MKNLVFALALVAFAPMQTLAADSLPTQTIVIESPPCAFPSKETTSVDLMQRAASCLEAKQMAEAIPIYFAGQIRLRTLAIIDKNPAGMQTTLSSLTYALGPAVNGWAGGDISTWMLGLADAIEWDKKTAFTELDTVALKNFRNIHEARGIHERVRVSIYTLIGKIRDDRVKIYQRRDEQNFPVRDPWWTSEKKAIAAKAAKQEAATPPSAKKIDEDLKMENLNKRFEAGGLNLLRTEEDKSGTSQ